MNSGFALEERQRSTKFDPFFGEKPGRGKMIFAERCQVESEEWWSENGRMVELIVQCTGPGKRFNYPPLAATSQVTHVRVDPRSPQYRQLELDQAMQYIQNALHGGRTSSFIACSPSTERQWPPRRHTGA